MSEAGKQPQLGPKAEQGWQDLKLHIEWHPDSFWVAWVFADDPRVVRVYQQRVAELLAEQGRTQRIIEPVTPRETRECMNVILANDTRTAHCMWVTVLRHGSAPTTASEDSWSHAWQWLMMRANENRGPMSRHLRGGLILTTLPEYKTATAAAAPDLWSIRMLVLEPEAMVLDLRGLDGASLIRQLAESNAAKPGTGPESAPDPELALQQAARMQELGDSAGEAEALVRAAAGLWARWAVTDIPERKSELLRKTMMVAIDGSALLRTLAARLPERYGVHLLQILLLLATVNAERGELALVRDSVDEAEQFLQYMTAGDVQGRQVVMNLMATILIHLALEHVTRKEWSKARSDVRAAVRIARELSDKHPVSGWHLLVQGLVLRMNLGEDAQLTSAAYNEFVGLLRAPPVGADIEAIQVPIISFVNGLRKQGQNSMADFIENLLPEPDTSSSRPLTPDDTGAH